MIALLLALAAQQMTTTCQQIGNQQVCNTELPPQPTGNPIIDALQPVGPSYNSQDLQRQQAENLRLQNRMMQRQLALGSARNASRKQCRSQAMSALQADDLDLAQAILSACPKP